MINADLPSPPDSGPEDTPLVRRDDDSGIRHRLSNSFRSVRDVLVVGIACIGAVSMGFGLGYSSPAIADPTVKMLLDDSSKQSWFGSLIAVGALIGGPLGAIFVSRLGRKLTLILCDIPLVIGWFLIIYAKEAVLLYIGRFLTGLGIGAVSLSAPVYIAEVSTPQRRGALGTGFQLMVTIGIFLAYALGAGLNWSWLAVVGATLAFLHALLLLFIPETPRYLLMKRDRPVRDITADTSFI